MENTKLVSQIVVRGRYARQIMANQGAISPLAFFNIFGTGVASTEYSKRVISMNAVIFFLVWAVLGGVYFVYDTLQNEERWSRSEGHWLETLVTGPVIWVMLVLITLLGRGLMLFGYLRGKPFW